MNNDNFNKLGYVSHEMIDNIQKLGHEFLNATLENSVPIINTFANTNLQTDSVDMMHYYIKDVSDKIYVLCEVPGTSKQNTRVNYTNNTLKISSKTGYGISGTESGTDSANPWGFVNTKNYYREIKIGCVDKDSISITHKDGCLYIVVDKINDSMESNIEIN
mgnify:CR=1 FL=1